MLLIQMEMIILLWVEGKHYRHFGVQVKMEQAQDMSLRIGRAERKCGTLHLLFGLKKIGNDNGGGDGNRYAPEGFDPLIGLMMVFLVLKSHVIQFHVHYIVKTDFFR